MSAPSNKPVYQPYGIWPWLGGIALAAALIVLLFAGTGGV